jgi:hypothetical protein
MNGEGVRMGHGNSPTTLTIQCTNLFNCASKKKNVSDCNNGTKYLFHQSFSYQVKTKEARV